MSRRSAGSARLRERGLVRPPRLSAGAVLTVASLLLGITACIAGDAPPPPRPALQGDFESFRPPVSGGSPATRWSLDFDGRTLHATDIEGHEFVMSRTVEVEGNELRLAPDPECGDDRTGGTYRFTRTGPELTFRATTDDGCPDRQQVLTAWPWRSYVPADHRSTDATAEEGVTVLARFLLPRPPKVIAFGFGSVWVTVSDDSTVYRIDPASNSIVARIPAGLPHAVRELSIAHGAVWVSDFPADRVLRIDPASNRVVASVPVGSRPVGTLGTGDSVWVANNSDGSLSRIDPRRAAAVGSVVVAPPGTGGPSHLALLDGQLYVLLTTAQEIRRVDPVSGTVSPFYAGRVCTSNLTAAFGAVWTSPGCGASAVSRIDRDGREQHIAVGGSRRPRALAAMDNTLYAATVGDEAAPSVEVARIYPDSGQVTARRSSPPSKHPDAALGVGAGDLWLGSGQLLLRIKPF